MSEIKFKDHPLKHRFQPDFICYDKIIVEVKAVSALINDHRAQILNYLNASKLKLGLLVNFGSSPNLTYERFVL
jgi:GxxExxY protein